MGGKLLSDKDAERLERMLRHFERHKNDKPIQRRRPLIISDKTDIKIFEVQSVATGDGVYNCYEQKLDATEWTGTEGNDKFVNAEAEGEETEVEVFNLEESDVEATYSPALAKYDLIKAWQINDDENNSRWIGQPLVTTPRLAITTEAAPAATNITCNLIDRLGDEITTGLGSSIEVYSKTVTTSNLNANEIRLGDDSYVMIENIRGKWYFSQIFQGGESCVCTPPE